MVICLERRANDLHMVQLMPLPLHHLCFSKFQNGLSFLYWPAQVVIEKAIKRMLLFLAFEWEPLLYLLND